MAHQILENHLELKDTVIIGLQPRGIFLSDKIVDSGRTNQNNVIPEKDVKEFVRRLKVEINTSSLVSRGVKNNFISKLNKLAGEKLI